MASIDELKSLATVKLGFARPNQFLVELPTIGSGARNGLGGFLAGLLPIPSIPGIIDAGNPAPREMNILCSNVNLPGKRILSTERRIGMEFENIAYGYAIDDVSMTFYLMNDYGVKRYFDAWVSTIINEETGDVAYKNEYAKSVKIHQLRKAQTGFSRNIGPFRGNLEIGGGSIYTVELIKAFPRDIQTVELNNELDGLIQLTIQMSYTRWRSVPVNLSGIFDAALNIG